MTDLAWLTARPIAHRGFHDLNRLRWENTLPAFAAAIERDYAIECDVHLTADGVPVVFHDSDLRRLTGTEGKVWQRTAAEMSALTIGDTTDRVPLLTDLLELAAGRVPLIIELKGDAGHDGGLVEAVAHLLGKYSGRAAVMSFDHWLIRQFPGHAPGIPSGLTAHGTTDADLEAHFSMLAHDIAFVSFSVRELPNRFVRFVRERLGMPVITWTVSDEKMVEATHRHADQMTFEGFEP